MRNEIGSINFFPLLEGEGEIYPHSFIKFFQNPSKSSLKFFIHIRDYNFKLCKGFFRLLQTFIRFFKTR